MSQDQKTTETKSETKPPVEVLKKQAESKIQSIETQLKSFEGKNGYNPFIWKRDNKWDSLVTGVNKGDTVSIAKVLALPGTINPSVKNVVVLEEDFPKVKAPFAPPNGLSSATPPGSDK